MRLESIAAGFSLWSAVMLSTVPLVVALPPFVGTLSILAIWIAFEVIWRIRGLTMKHMEKACK